MGARFCFFTDPGKLAEQSAASAFGPLAADQGKDRFRITHRHETVAAGAPAIAVCDGILCAQTEISGALTLILKPSQTPPFEAPVVSYFIYKGIDPASLLNGDAVIDETHADANPLTKRVAATWKEQNASALAGSRAGLGLDRDGAFRHVASDPASKVFTDADPVERLFTYPHPKFQLPLVRAGDRIGAFGAACGFEIVLLRLGYRPKLGFARKADNVVEVPSLPATNGGASWQPDDYDFFAHWHAKEQVLAYMDPAAYFGAFIQAKLYKSDGDDTDRVKGKDIYGEILATFANRNIAWLDIRNNYGYSYNLFGLYGNTFRFVSPTDPAQTNDIDFRSAAWPLVQVGVSDTRGTRSGLLQKTRLQLPAGFALAPALLVSKGFVTRLGPERKERRLPLIARSADPAFLTPISIAFPAHGKGAQAVLTASYTRLNLYELAATSPVALDLAKGEYLDGLFRLSDLRLDKNFSANGLRFAIYPEEVLVNLSAVGGSVYAGSVAVAEDPVHAAALTLPTCFLSLRTSNGASPVASLTDKFEGNPGGLVAWLARSFPHRNLTRAIIDANSPTKVDTLIVRAPVKDGPTEEAGHGNIDDYCLIVLAANDYAAMLASFDATIPAHAFPVFSHVAAAVAKTDALTNAHYFDRTLTARTYARIAGSAKIALADTGWVSQVVEHAHQ
jgi:hypothetical protein